jgi:hypothetical protein
MDCECAAGGGGYCGAAAVMFLWERRGSIIRLGARLGRRVQNAHGAAPRLRFITFAGNTRAISCYSTPASSLSGPTCAAFGCGRRTGAGCVAAGLLRRLCGCWLGAGWVAWSRRRSWCARGKYGTPGALPRAASSCGQQSSALIKPQWRRYASSTEKRWMSPVPCAAHVRGREGVPHMSWKEVYTHTSDGHGGWTATAAQRAGKSRSFPLWSTQVAGGSVAYGARKVYAQGGVRGRLPPKAMRS